MPEDRTDRAQTDGQGGVRRPYVAPFLRRLDVLDTEGKAFTYVNELNPYNTGNS